MRCPSGRVNALPKWPRTFATAARVATSGAARGAAVPRRAVLHGAEWPRIRKRDEVRRRRLSRAGYRLARTSSQPGGAAFARNQVRRPQRAAVAVYLASDYFGRAGNENRGARAREVDVNGGVMRRGVGGVCFEAKNFWQVLSKFKVGWKFRFCMGSNS